MRTLLIAIAISIAAATTIHAQAFFSPCLGLETYNNGIWGPREAFVEPAVRINPLGRYRWEFYMPVAGRCVGAFDSYAEINGANSITREMLGQYTGVAMSKPTGDVEILILTDYEYAAWRYGRSTTTRGGSRGLSTGGRFEVDLGPGWHHLIINNAHSGFTAKIVSIMFGGRAPDRKM